MKDVFKTDTYGVLIANAVTVLPFPPTASGDVTNWTNDSNLVDYLDISIWSAAAVTLTLAELYGAEGHPFVIAGTALDSVTNATDTLTKVAHGFLTGDGPVRLTTSGTLPAGFVLLTDYWIVKTGVNTFKLANTRANAMAAIPIVVDFTTDGTGTHTVTGTAATERVSWHSHGLLGKAADGTVVLTTQQAYTVRAEHVQKTFAYAVTATLSGAVATSIIAYPVLRR